MSDDAPNLGACCMCETLDGVRNIIMLDRRCVVAGHGWGCFVCGLSGDGASAVLCDACLGRYQADNSALTIACRGYPASDGRVAIAVLPPFAHDPAKHPELRAEVKFDPRAAWAALDDETRRTIGEACLLQQVAIEAQVLAADAHDGPFPAVDIGAVRRWEHAEHEAQRLLTDAIPIDADLYDRPDLAALGIRACRVCGCTTESGCAGGCWWVEADLCSNCAPPLTAEQWNDRYPIGTNVVVTRDDRTEHHTATRSEAWTLGHGQAVVKVVGISGGYALERVRPV